MKVSLALLGLVFLWVVSPAAHAETCSGTANAGGPMWIAEATCGKHPIEQHGHIAQVVQQHSEYKAYRWLLRCRSGPAVTSEQNCSSGVSCGDGFSLYEFQGLKGVRWITLRVECRADAPAAANAPPQVTPGMVAHAFARIPLPTYPSIAQPSQKTLVNFETIFHTGAAPLTRHVTLLGQRVTLQIRPATFRWEFGDGTTLTTTTAGQPYPSKTIVHRYQHAHLTVSHRVTITWTATFRLNRGPTRPVPGTVTRTGPATDLRISEATPVLSGYGH